MASNVGGESYADPEGLPCESWPVAEPEELGEVLGWKDAVGGLLLAMGEQRIAPDGFERLLLAAVVPVEELPAAASSPAVQFARAHAVKAGGELGVIDWRRLYGLLLDSLREA